MIISEMFKIQKKYNDKIFKEKNKKSVIEDTKTLALSLHTEVSDLVKAVNYKSHYPEDLNVESDILLYESVDVFRYLLAILNLHDIDSKDFIGAFKDKDTYLNYLDRNQESWNGKDRVVIVDIDDVLSEFRLHFARWLEREYDLMPDVESDQYYFIREMSQLEKNPEVVFEEFMNSGGFRNIPVVRGSKDMLRQLRSKGYFIQLLTARPKDNLRCFYDTYHWLDANEIPFDALDFSAENLGGVLSQDIT